MTIKISCCFLHVDITTWQFTLVPGTRKLTAGFWEFWCPLEFRPLPYLTESSLSKLIHTIPPNTDTHTPTVLWRIDYDSAFCPVSQNFPEAKEQKETGCLLGIWGGDKIWEGDDRLFLNESFEIFHRWWIYWYSRIVHVVISFVFTSLIL